MKILSNGYNSNCPNIKINSSGGTATFEKIFLEQIKKTKNKWVSVFNNFSKTNPKYKIEFKEKNITWWSVSFKKDYLNKIIKTKKRKIKKEEELSDLILVFEKLLKKESPDIVLLNGVSIFIWCLFKAASNLNIKTVIQHAGIWHFELDNYAKYFSKKGLELMKEMEKDISINSSANIFLNKTSQNVFLDKVIKINKNKLNIIPLPIPMEKYKNINKENITNNILKIGMVGRWDIIKNHEAFLNIAMLSNKLNLSWEFYSVTTIPETKNKIKLKNNYKKYIKILPPMDKNKLNNFYSEMDLMILPSHFDVSPHVVIEAAVLNTPTLISKGVGHVDIIKKFNNNDFIIDFSDPNKVIDRINKIKNKKYSKELIEEFKKIHSIDNVVKEYFNIFNKIRI